MNFQKSDLVALYSINKHPDLLKHLNDTFGEPVDSYWNGSHTWFTEEDDLLVEWRMHPVTGFVTPEASRPEELFTMAIEDEVDPLHYWEGLEVFPVDEHTYDETTFSQYCEEKLGIAPDLCGLVDHETIGNAYERTQGKVSIVQMLLDQLNS